MFTVIFKLSNSYRQKHLSLIQKKASCITGFSTMSEVKPAPDDSPESFAVYTASFADEISRNLFRLLLRFEFDIPSLY